MAVASWYHNCYWPRGYSTDQRGSSGLNQALLCSSLRGPFQEIMIISCTAAAAAFAVQALGALSGSAWTSAPEGDWPAHLPVPSLSPLRENRRGISEEQGELQWRSLFCVWWIWHVGILHSFLGWIKHFYLVKNETWRECYGTHFSTICQWAKPMLYKIVIICNITINFSQ